ncbi:hypothetical protein LTR97_000782 [Elasticomyces elasticus]|uniref:Uncharacterized protein n=1 Tax=Elasticomyces elasticus TaxID=574655 RepID=A0AAN7ZR22_9PEZI|nr:hypothetical protein LTR97_000782 [Elasticomyces elasticus]
MADPTQVSEERTTAIDDEKCKTRNLRPNNVEKQSKKIETSIANLQESNKVKSSKRILFELKILDKMPGGALPAVKHLLLLAKKYVRHMDFVGGYGEMPDGDHDVCCGIRNTFEHILAVNWKEITGFRLTPS